MSTANTRQPAITTWNIDPAHTVAEFKVANATTTLMFDTTMNSSFDDIADQESFGMPAFTIYGNVPHMHTLGRRMTMELDRADGTKSVVFDSEPLDEAIEILGAAEAELEVSAERPQAQLA